MNGLGRVAPRDAMQRLVFRVTGRRGNLKVYVL